MNTYQLTKDNFFPYEGKDIDLSDIFAPGDMLLALPSMVEGLEQHYDLKKYPAKALNLSGAVDLEDACTDLYRVKVLGISDTPEGKWSFRPRKVLSRLPFYNTVFVTSGKDTNRITLKGYAAAMPKPKAGPAQGQPYKHHIGSCAVYEEDLGFYFAFALFTYPVGTTIKDARGLKRDAA